MRTAYITHPACLKHDMGFGHPETPARIHAIEDRLIAAGLMPYLDCHEAAAATRADLQLVHDDIYIDDILARSPEQGLVYLDDDTVMNPHSLNAALYAAGAAVLAGGSRTKQGHGPCTSQKPFASMMVGLAPSGNPRICRQGRFAQAIRTTAR